MSLHMLGIIKKAREVGKDVEKREEPWHPTDGIAKVQSPWKTVWRFLTELKMELPFNPAIPPLVVYPKEIQSLS